MRQSVYKDVLSVAEDFFDLLDKHHVNPVILSNIFFYYVRRKIHTNPQDVSISQDFKFCIKFLFQTMENGANPDVSGAVGLPDSLHRDWIS